MKNTIFHLIEKNIPTFVRTLYPNAKNLILDFFKFLESDNQHLSVLLDFKENTDIDNQIEPYIDYFLSELGWNYQHPITIDKRMLIFLLRDLYLSKGSKKSFNVLFKVLFGNGCEIDYPRNYLFTLSNASYSNDTTIITTAKNIDVPKFKELIDSNNFSVSIKGIKSKINSICNKIDVVVKDNLYYLIISIDPIMNDFIKNESIELYSNTISFNETIFNNVKLDIINKGNYYEKNDIINIIGCEFTGLARVAKVSKGYIKDIDIVSGGLGYKVGDVLKTNIDSGGVGFYAEVSSISNLGEILTIKLYNQGYDYKKRPTINIKTDFGRSAVILPIGKDIGGIETIEYVNPYWKSTTNLDYSIDSLIGTDAILSINLDSCKFDLNNTYKNYKGFLGTQNSILHDSNFFQHFSYSIMSDNSENEYKTIVDDLLHPVGFVRYNKCRINSKLTFNPSTITDSIVKIKILEMTLLTTGMLSSTQTITKTLQSSAKYVIPNSLSLEHLKLSINLDYPSGYFDNYSLDTINTTTIELKTIDPELIQEII